MHASTSTLGCEERPESMHSDICLATLSNRHRMSQQQAQSLERGARRLFVTLRCLFCTLWAVFAIRVVVKLVPLADLASMPLNTRYVAAAVLCHLGVSTVRTCRQSAVSVPAQLICAALAAVGGILVELHCIFRTKTLSTQYVGSD